MTSRIDALRDLRAASPEDPFLQYALAMALREEGRLAESLAEFQDLIARSPDYAPAYLMAGQCAQSLGDTEEAARLLRLGIEVCRRAGEAHARQKCEEALAALSGRSG